MAMSLAKVLDDVSEPSGTRSSAAVLLAELGDVRAVPSLVRALQFRYSKPDRGFQASVYAAAYILDMMWDDKRELLRRLKKRSGCRALVKAALKALERGGDWHSIIAGDPPPSEEWESEPDALAEYRGALEKLLEPGDATSVSIALMDEIDEGRGTEEAASLRMNAAASLGAIGGKRAVSSLIAALNDDDEDVRHTVAEALVRASDRRAVGGIKDAVDRGSLVVEALSDEAIAFLGWRVKNTQYAFTRRRQVIRS